MALATWWAGDALPTLDPLPGFRAAVSADNDALARLAEFDLSEVRARLDGGHRPYVASLDGNMAGYGWVAGAGATIGELKVSFVLPRGDRYLWDFATWAWVGFVDRSILSRLRLRRKRQLEGNRTLVVEGRV